jgi:hypothetical protein
MITQAITNRDLEAAAAEALGGIPARPPTVPDIDSPEAQAARDSFAARHMAPTMEPLGHPNFDEPTENETRRATVAALRQRLGGLARLIKSEHAELIPKLEGLQSVASDLAVSEKFNVAAGMEFLNRLNSVLSEFIAPVVSPPAVTEPSKPVSTKRESVMVEQAPMAAPAGKR